jgi:2-amino-4-hydroxy-6-hydroxymethyldihydropteridine diphosphokinase
MHRKSAADAAASLLVVAVPGARPSRWARRTRAVHTWCVPAMRDAVIAYVALGANLGDAAQTVRDAIARIGELPDTAVVRQSSLYLSAPVDSSGPDYVNAVVEISTRLGAPQLLAQLQGIENTAGRQRPYRNAPRTLDLDLLVFGSASIDSPRLQVPHPRMNDRAFVLVPLAEIAPNLVSSERLKAVAGQKLVRVSPAA